MRLSILFKILRIIHVHRATQDVTAVPPKLIVLFVTRAMRFSPDNADSYVTTGRHHPCVQSLSICLTEENTRSICSLELHAHTFNCFCVWSTLLSQFSGDVYSYFSEYRDQAGACQSCTIESCEICGNATECVTCYPNATKYHQGCVSECPNNTFLNVRENSTSQEECIE